jgi:flagellar biosynthetic protein FliR
MHAEVTFNLSSVYGFLLVLARVSGVIVFVPLPGFSAGPDSSRIVLALALTMTLSPVWPAPVLDGQALRQVLGLGRLLGWMGAEGAFGLTLGVAVAFLLEGVQMGAQVIGLQAGYSYASTVNPDTEADTTTLQLLAQLFAGSLFFAFGFDRQVIRIMAQSLESVPSGSYLLNGPAAVAITRLGAGIFSIGLQLAIPVLALMLLLDIAFGVLGRLHSQLQLLGLSFGVKMLVGLAFLSGVVRFYPAIFEKAGAATLGIVLRLVTH